MKRWIVILLTAMAVMLTVDLCAQDRQRGVEISGGTDLVSGYVWRGVWEAGVSLQPTLALAAGNFSVAAWGSVDFAATSYKEMDLTMAYALGPVTFSLADLYWEGGAGELIVADEPTSNLDRESAEVVMGMLIQARQAGAGVLLVTHDTLGIGASNAIYDMVDGELKLREEAVQSVDPKSNR